MDAGGAVYSLVDLTVSAVCTLTSTAVLAIAAEL